MGRKIGSSVGAPALQASGRYRTTLVRDAHCLGSARWWVARNFQAAGGVNPYIRSTGDSDVRDGRHVEDGDQSHVRGGGLGGQPLGQGEGQGEELQRPRACVRPREPLAQGMLRGAAGALAFSDSHLCCTPPGARCASSVSAAGVRQSSRGRACVGLCVSERDVKESTPALTPCVPKPPGGLTNESEVSSHGSRRSSAYVGVVVLGVLRRTVFWALKTGPSPLYHSNQ